MTSVSGKLTCERGFIAILPVVLFISAVVAFAGTHGLVSRYLHKDTRRTQFQSDLEDLRLYILNDSVCPTACTVDEYVDLHTSAGDLLVDKPTTSPNVSYTKAGASPFRLRIKCEDCATDAVCLTEGKNRRLVVEYLNEGGLLTPSQKNWQKLFGAESDAANWCLI